MTATFFLVRHGANDLMDSHISGRTPGLRLNEQGRAQAEQIAAALGHLPIQAVFTGPLQRACETAQPLCAKLQLPLHEAVEFSELDFGDWSNQRLEALQRLPDWQHWNRLRSFSVAPGGETMLEVQARVVRKLIELQARYERVAIFSHGDAIRATLAYFLGMPVDLFLRIRLDAASISVVELGDDHVQVRLMNGSAAAPISSC